MAALCPLPDNHFKRNSGDRRVVRGEGAGAAAPPDRLRLSEALADEVLALRPARLCALGVERLGQHAGPDVVPVCHFSPLAIPPGTAPCLARACPTPYIPVLAP